jgi:hypothetical protein
LKVHTFCCFPLVVELWSSWLPAKSLAPVVTTALYLVFAASRLEAFRVALRPSELRATVTFVVCVVEPVEVTLKSLKVDLVTEVEAIFSENVAVGLTPFFTPKLVGVVEATLGEVRSLS